MEGKTARMAGNATCARSVEGAASACMAGNAASARNVEGPASASMAGDAAAARSVEAAASAYMAGNATSARSVEGPASASMAGNAAAARSVEAAASASMAGVATGAKSVEGAASASMASVAAGATSAKRRSVAGKDDRPLRPASETTKLKCAEATAKLGHFPDHPVHLGRRFFLRVKAKCPIPGPRPLSQTNSNQTSCSGRANGCLGNLAVQGGARAVHMRR